MELRQLQYFLTVAEEKSFAKASKKAFISQQALSKSIMSLEQELGITLFDRGPHGVTLTDAGQLLFRHAYSISYYVANAEKEIKNFRNPENARVNLGVARGIENAPFFFKILDFEKTNPGFHLSTFSSDDETVERMIIEGTVELGIIGGLSNHNQITYIPLYNPPMFLACSINNPLAEKSKLVLSDLKDQPLIGSSNFYHFYNRLNTLCNLQGFSPFFAYQTENILYIHHILQNNQGCFLCPWDDIHYLNSPDVRLIPFEEASISFSVFLGYKTGTQFSEITKRLFTFITDLYGVPN